MRILSLVLFFFCVNTYALDEISQKKADYEFKGLTSLAEQGDADAQFKLGQIYQRGSMNVKKDPLEAVKWFRKAADQDNERALCQLGYSYVLGFGVKKDMSEAVKCFHKAAVLGSTGAFSFFANCYTVDNGIYLDSGLSKNDIEAYAYYILARSGDKILSNKLTPSQIEAGKKRSQELKMQFLREYLQLLTGKAEKGDVKSQIILGAKYQVGVEGFSKDLKEAIKWYSLAANKGNTKALWSLGRCYLDLNQPQEAIKWFSKSLALGNTNAKNSIGECYQTLGTRYLSGRGVDKDLNEAYAYYKLAALNNNYFAKRYIERVEKNMTPEEIEAGEKRSKEIQTQMEAIQ
jgi:TPR repeat protein